MDELWLADLDVSQVYDNDTTTCLEFTNITPFLTLLQKAPFRSTFTLDIILKESHHHAAIRVLTSETEATSCSQPKELKQCQRANDNLYHCLCELNCQVSVKLMLMSKGIPADETLKICEIFVTRFGILSRMSHELNI